MAVLINKETGLAENLTPQQEQAAMAAGTHEVPLYDPQGQPTAVPHAEAAQLLQSGYSLPKPDEYKHMLKYATAAGQPIQAGVEAAASAATFGASRMLGDAEMQALRKEANPIAETVGTLGGLGASMLTGVGAAPIMEKIGLMGATALGLGEATAAARVGTTAAKLGIENAVFQVGSEVDKMLLKDPEQSLGTAILNTGASALLGAGLGAGAKGVGELWSATAGKKLSGLLDAYKNKVNGVASADVGKAAGLELAPEMAAVLGETPEAHRAFQTLMESNTPAGQKMQQLYKEFKEASDVAIRDTVGGPVSMDIESLGEEMKKLLVKQLRETADPVGTAMSKFNDAFGKIPLSVEDKAAIGEAVNKIAIEEGWHKIPSSKANSMVKNVLKEIQLQETANDLRKYISNLRDNNQPLTEGFRPAMLLGNIIEDQMGVATERMVGARAPEALDKYLATKAEYAKLKGLFEDLNDRLKAGYKSKGHGVETFSRLVKDMQAEDVVKRLSPKGDAAFARILEQSFPEVSAAMKQIELNKLVNKARDGELISAKKLFKQIENLSNENQAYLDFILPKEKLDRLKAIDALLDKVPNKMNPSGTAKTLDSLWAAGPAGVGAAIGSLFGGPVGGIIGAIGAHYGKQAPDAVRLSVLKFLGSEMPTNALGMRAAIDYSEKVIKGAKLLDKANKSIFEGGAKVIPFPEAKSLEKMNQLVAQNEQGQYHESELAHYMPEHATSATMHSVQVSQYLKSLQPDTAPLTPLAKPRVPNAMEKARYKEALQIAEQPGILLNYIKDGTLTNTQVHHLQAMYPQLYAQMQDKLMHGLMEHKAKDGMLPYKVKLSLSVFMQQPLDNSLLPQAIMANQMPQQQPMQQTAPISKTNKLSRQPASYATPMQNREMDRNRH